MKTKVIILLFFLVIILYPVYLHDQPLLYDFYSGYNNPLPSPRNNQLIAFAGESFDKVYLYSLPTEEMIEISGGKSSGYKFYWSLDGKYLGFKHLIEIKEYEEFLHLPVIYDITRQEWIPLCEPQPFCGIPSFSADGKIVYSVGNKIKVLDKNLHLIDEIEIQNYSNITPISPDGKYIAYNDDNEQIWLVDLVKKVHKKISDDSDAYYDPIWSWDSKKVILKTITGHIKVYELTTGQLYYIDKGLSPQWDFNSEYVFYHKIETSGNGFNIEKSVICISKFNGTEKSELTSKEDGLLGNCAVLPLAGTVIYKNFVENKFYFVPLRVKKTVGMFGVIQRTKIEIDRTQKQEVKIKVLRSDKTIDKDVIKKFGIKIKK